MYNNNFKMSDIFMNPALGSVFPQFERGEWIKNVYSFADTESRVLKYLAGTLNGTVTGRGELTVRGKAKTIMGRVQALKPLIEALFNNIPNIAKNLRTNSKLYMPFATRSELECMDTYGKRKLAIKAVVDNIKYNPEFNTTQSLSPYYTRQQNAWKKRVGYKE